MSAPSGFTEASASVLEADPGLPRTFGVEPILSVLALPPGRWRPPERDALGDGTVALVVLDGFLAAGSPPLVNGPGDVLEPWDPAVAWTTATPVRLAVIDTRYLGAVRLSPGAAARLLARVGAGLATRYDGSLHDRALGLLWRVASRWGVPGGDTVSLPPALDTRALAALLHSEKRDVARAVAVLAGDGRLTGNDGNGWHLPAAVRGAGAPRSGHSHERRDELRARGAHQIALARSMRSQHESITEQIHAELARRPARL